VGDQETLSGGLAFEALHPSLPLTDRKVGVFRSVVLPEPSWSMKVLQTQRLQGDWVGTEATGGDGFGLHGVSAQQPLEQFPGRPRAPACLMTSAGKRWRLNDNGFRLRLRKQA
jgi:hypothetical protein